MTIDFEPDETESAVLDALGGLCRQHCPDSLVRADDGAFPTGLWAALADFGLFTLGAADGLGGIVEIAAAGDVLGGCVAPGPLGATFFAAQLLSELERDLLVSGRAIASLVAPPLIPWPDAATLLIETDGERAWRAAVDGPVERLETLGGEPWGRASIRRTGDFGAAGRAGAVHDVFMAAYLAAAARKLLRDASDYVSNRRQFGKTLSQFQAVSQPLAECAIRVRAASTLARIAGHELDENAADAVATAACARLSAEGAALKTVYVCHQSYGAMGMTVDGPVYYVSRRIRQLANLQKGLWPKLRTIEAGYADADLPELRVALG